MYFVCEFGQSRTHSLLAYWSAGQRQQRLWENGICITIKNFGFSAHASAQNGSENDSPRESLNLFVSVVHTMI